MQKKYVFLILVFLRKNADFWVVFIFFTASVWPPVYKIQTAVQLSSAAEKDESDKIQFIQ